MTQKFVNNFAATVAQTFGAADTYLYINNAAPLGTLTVGEYYLLTVFRKTGVEESGHEVVKVTAITDNMLTVERSTEGAAASLFNVGDHVECRVTAKGLTDKADSAHHHDSSYEPKNANIQAHIADTANPHGVTKAQVGLSNVDNTSDADKPVSTAQQAALNGKENTGTAAAAVAAHEAAGDPHPQYQVDLVSGTNIKTINGQSILGAGNIEIQGGGGVGVTLSGDTNIYVTQSKTYTITNYNVFSSYVVQVSAGSVSISGDQITFTAPTAAQTVTLTVNMDSVATEFSLVVQGAGVSAPTIISPSNGATVLGQAPTFVSSALASIGLSDAFLNADHEVRTGPNGTGALIASSYANTGSETTWTMPGSLLAVATQYYYRKLHRGVSLGAGPWSEISFTTAASFGGLIGTQGGQGFGVGVCTNPSRLTALGLSEMTGTTDKTHANYGNYQHSNGGVSVYRPKFFYRIGHPSSPRYATYGANAVDIVGIETFANEAAANAAGYAMSRSFKNAGVEVDGYFRDKYLASKDGTTSCKSIANADPISLTTSASYNPSSTMTGCTGILADAVVLARARGAGWNADFFPMAFDSAIIALAHGQASTSSTYCAWYDASGVTNFPKGCNNGSLADVNDATVTYTASYSEKPKTRANANFAKTTDNGQECGIADVNGSMWQVMIGLTMAGTSATDTTAITSGNAYLLKTTADFAALTGGFGGTHDAWGTTSSLTTDFDLITGFEPWLGTTGWIYLGNGANAVFSNATSGTDYLRTCAGIPLLTGTNATGTSQFGNDGCYQYGRANQVPLAAGLWSSAAVAGVFSRYWSNLRSNDAVSHGFRCAAY